MASEAPHRGPRRLAWLDSLRGIAVLAVVIQHYFTARAFGAIAVPNQLLFGWLDIGRLGVDIFFAISGYIITYSLARDDERGRPVWHFALHRVFRLYPAYWLSLAAAAALLLPPLPVLAWNVTMLQQFFGHASLVGPYWTLQAEIVFYFLCALLYGAGLIGKCVTAPALCLAFLFLALVAGLVHFVVGRELPITLAVVLAIMFLGFSWRVMDRRSFLALLAAFALLLPLVYWLEYGSRPALVGAPPWYLTSTASTFGAIGLFLVVSRWRLSWAPLAGLGLVSYSVNLLFEPVFALLTRLGLTHSFAGTVLAMLAVIAAGAASYRLVERPFVRWSHRLTDDQTAAVS